MKTDDPVKKASDLRAKVIADLRKSGFGAELAALQIFHNEHFRTTARQVYFDKILNNQREIDIAADMEKLRHNDQKFICQAVVSVFAEVKKSDRPWVVLRAKTYENPYNVHLADALIDEFNTPTLRQYTLRESLAKISANPPGGAWFGHGVQEAFKSPGDLSTWHKAASSVCRAAWNAARPTHQDNLGSVWLRHPVVVLEGKLFSAWSDESFEMQLAEGSRVTILFRETNAVFDRRFLVDLVVMGSLRSYASEIKQRLEIAHGQLWKRLNP